MTEVSNGASFVADKIGVLLINLGTPDSPHPKDVRRYLAEFLSDKRVVEIPALIWQPILRGLVLTTRPKKSANAYSLVWRPDGSPLAAITRAQARALQDVFGDRVIVDHAMRYGNPAIADRLHALRAQGCGRILLAPLYPQYCGATTATANDKAFAALGKMRWQPAVRTLPPYEGDAAYIDALKVSVERGLADLDFVPDTLVASFHGMPQRAIDLGDPYEAHCRTTARLLEEALGRKILVTFQSRFGRAKWLEPATDMVLKQQVAEGKKKVAIFAPGFSADCLETLEELAIRGKKNFLEQGGSHFAYIPCLNETEVGVEMLRKIVSRELEGWLDPA